jgi:cell division protein ZapE
MSGGTMSAGDNAVGDWDGMVGRVLAAYEAQLSDGGFAPDPAQRAVVGRLDVLAGNLELEVSQRSGLFARWRRGPPIPPRGLYIHGGVGRGKTMLMDLFFEKVSIQAKRRLHFHAFMAQAHERIAAARSSVKGDPLPAVAEAIATEAHLLCFDELFVNDIADAMVLGRLFRGLFERGVIVVATSNVAPDGLYRNGLNRQLFLPFIDEIEDRLDVVELASARDFRLEKLSGQRLYFSPLNGDSARARRTLAAVDGADAGSADRVAGERPQPRGAASVDGSCAVFVCRFVRSSARCWRLSGLGARLPYDFC